MGMDSIMMLVKVVLVFVLLFIALPSLVFKHNKNVSLFDRIFIPLIHSSVFVIVVVHLLVTVKLFESLSLIGVCLAGFVYAKRRNRTLVMDGSESRTMTGLFDISESRAMLRTILISWRSALVSALRSSALEVIALVKTNLLPIILIACTLGVAGYIRFQHVLTHYYFASSDPYFHMKWAKFLQKNIIFVDGVYNHGFETVLAALSRFFMMDMYDLIRFIGPISGMLIVLSIGYAVRLFGSNLYAAFIAMFTYSVFSFLPSYVWRQLSALPMEYAAIFYMPGIAFWILYCRDGSKKHLILAAECLFLTVIIHPFTAAIHGLAIGLVALIHLRKLYVRRQLWPSVCYLGAAGLAGMLPLAVGLAAGIPFFDSINYIQDSIQTPGEAEISLWSSLIGWMTPADIIWLVVATVLLGGLIWLHINKRSKLGGPGVGVPTFIVVCLIFFILFKADKLGLPVVVPLDRFGVFFAPYAAACMGIVLLAVGSTLESGMRRRYLTSFISIAASIVIVLSGHTVAMPVAEKFQYDKAVQAYLTIKNQHASNNWTIVSPVEEYPMVEAFGYHTNLWEFVRDTEPGSDNTIGFETEHVFFYVEVDPLYGEGLITAADALLPFPEPIEGDLTEFYYRSDHRKTLEAKLYNWAMWYMREHPDKMSLMVDEPHFKVFHLKQVAKTPADPLPKLPVEERGVW